MTEKTKKTDKVAKSNFQGGVVMFKALTREFRAGMKDKKKEKILLNKLLSHKENGDITPDELSFLWEMLENIDQQGRLDSKHQQMLYNKQASECQNEAVCISDSVPLQHHLKDGMKCPYESVTIRNYKNEMVPRLMTFIPRVIPSNHQYSKEVVITENRGHTVPAEKYPDAKKVWVKRYFMPEEFEQWFMVDEDDELTQAMEEQAYNF